MPSQKWNTGPITDYTLVSGTRESDYQRFEPPTVSQRMRVELLNEE